MAAPATVDEFLDLVRKSGVVDDKRFDTYLQKNRDRLPGDANQAAEVLLRDGLITLFQQENILAGRWRRFFIGKYKVLEKLGSGGMGQVYLCEHTLMRRRVAVKVLPTAKAKDSSALERFYREARAVAALTHPNIVHAYDIDENDDLHFLVMEYVDGANLQDIVKKSGALNLARACYYIRQSALALQHAHEAGLVHRDVKPGNILVDRAGVVKLLDLGLARFFHDEDDILTKKYDENVLGTADYLSPEQALDSHTADIRADIYSLGATFYFLLTGRPPFESANVAQKLMMHQMREPKGVQEYRRDVPAEVAAILQKMMAKSAENRFSVPGDVAEALLPFTQTTIAPPSEEEMPKLSPAATGGAAVSDSAETTLSKNHTPVSPRPVPGSGAGKSPAVATVVAPVQSTVKPVAKTAPQETPDIARWEEMANDTEDPSAKADTKQQSSRSASRSRKDLKTSRNTLTLFFALAFVMAIGSLVVLGVVGVLVWKIFYSPTAPPPVTGPTKLEVSKDPARKGPNTYDTIQKAVRNAKAESIIELWDSEYDENVVIESSNKGSTNMTLQAAPDKQIVWRGSKTSQDQPILRLSKAGDFKFKGKGITLDGSVDNTPKFNDLMLITADCTGMVVEDLQFKNFTRNAIRIINSTGTSTQPIQLLRLTITAPQTKNNSVAIFFEANPKVAPQQNAHIQIKSALFRGFPPNGAVHLQNDKVNEKSVSWTER